MDYSQLIDASIGRVYQTGIATKILQHMDRIRNVSDITQARRWVMELFQNSRDAAYEDQPVRVRILLDEAEGTLIFSHNGRPFRVKDILSIVNQVSSKSPEENTVGQFGTGFMTTYQLSEVVEIQAVLKEEGLPYKPFCIRLDRRGRTKEEILSGIAGTMEELKKADSQEELKEFCREDCHTHFIYHLTNQENLLAARTGLEDLKDTILYVLLFSERIAQVEWSWRGSWGEEIRRYERGEETVAALGGESEDGLGPVEIGTLAVFERSPLQQKVSRHTLAFAREESLTLAAELSEDQGFLSLSERTPRLFVDFPLIGAEKFPFPVVVNSPGFKTNEPRSGISLVDNAASFDALENKRLMDQAVRVYGRFLHWAVNEGLEGIENIIALPAWTPDREMSEAWVREHLCQGLFKLVAGEPFVKTAEGVKPLNDPRLCLVRAESEEEKEAVKGLLSPLKGYLPPARGERLWEALSGYGLEETRVCRLETLFEKAQELLVQELSEERMTALEWCQELYRLGLQNKELAVRLLAGELCVFPSQEEEAWRQRKLFSIRQVRRDPGIPEILKDVSEQLDMLTGQRSEEPLAIRASLLRQDFDCLGVEELEVYEWVKLNNYIAVRSNRGFPVREFSLNRQRYESAWEKSWRLMVSCGADLELYQLCKEIWGEEFPERTELAIEREPSVWYHSCKRMALELLDWIAGFENLKGLKDQGLKGWSEAEACQFLNQVLKRADRYLEESERIQKKVFPNQEGDFCCAGLLCEDRTQEEELKRLACEFCGLEAGCNFFCSSLDRRVEPGLRLRTLYDSEVAMKLNYVVHRLLAGQSLSQAAVEYQEACTRLLGWIQENRKKAQQYFPEFSEEEEQMKLLTPKAAVRLQRRANDYDSLMKGLGTDNPEEVLELVRQLREESGSVNRVSDSQQDMGRFPVGETEVFLDEELGGLSAEEAKAVCREAGQAGEVYALSRIKEHYLEEGFVITREQPEELLMRHPDSGRPIEIFYPDGGLCHQAGWDIRVTMNKGETGEEQVYYLEVKTHTRRSRFRNYLVLSNEQLKAAARQRQNYAVLHVIYNWEMRKGEELQVFQDPIERIAEGSLTSAEGRYLLAMKEK